MDIRKALKLYAVTDRAWEYKKDFMLQIEDALKGGVTMLQLREKKLSFDDFLAEAYEVRKLCGRYGVPFIVNDSVEIASRVNADGVHVGQSDLEASSARRILGSGKIIGVTAKTPGQAAAAEKAGADYLGAGAMFDTSTKLDTRCIGPDALNGITEAVSIPVAAIGGITKENMPLLKGRGAAGAALVSAVFGADDIESECRELLALCNEIFG